VLIKGELFPTALPSNEGVLIAIHLNYFSIKNLIASNERKGNFVILKPILSSLHFIFLSATEKFYILEF
jgi:hypothetical protein